MFAHDVSFHDLQIELAKDEGRRVDEYELLCLTNGSRVKFLDDGPFKRAALGTSNNETPMNPGRCRLLAAIKKRDKDGKPIWVSEKPGVRVYDFAIGEYREVPVLDDAAKARMARHLGVRDQRMARGKIEAAAAAKKAAEDNAANTEASVVAALAKVLGKAGATDEKPASKPAPSKGGAA